MYLCTTIAKSGRNRSDRVFDELTFEDEAAWKPSKLMAKIRRRRPSHRSSGSASDIGTILAEKRVQIAGAEYVISSCIGQHNDRSFAFRACRADGIPVVIRTFGRNSRALEVLSKKSHNFLHGRGIAPYLASGIFAVTHPSFRTNRSRSVNLYALVRRYEPKTLRDQLFKTSPQPHRDALNMLIDMASGINALHESDLIHGDLKPGNVLVTEALRALIADYTLHTVLANDFRADSTYAAPEVKDASLPEAASRAADVYSFGMLANLIDTELQRSSSVSLPRQAERIIRECISNDPAKRPKISSILEQLAIDFDSYPRDAGYSHLVLPAVTNIGQRLESRAVQMEGYVVDLSSQVGSKAAELDLRSTESKHLELTKLSQERKTHLLASATLATHADEQLQLQSKRGIFNSDLMVEFNHDQLNNISLEQKWLDLIFESVQPVPPEERKEIEAVVVGLDADSFFRLSVR